MSAFLQGMVTFTLVSIRLAYSLVSVTSEDDPEGCVSPSAPDTHSLCVSGDSCTQGFVNEPEGCCVFLDICIHVKWMQINMVQM